MMHALQSVATNAANDMADELNLPRSKAVTTIKPSGTQAKRMDVTEGIHKPLGKYIFNWIGFSRHDPHAGDKLVGCASRLWKRL